MSGHSKWNNIKRKKEKTDGQRAKIFTKLGREMAVAIKEGGPDPNSNGKLREIIAKAKANTVPSKRQWQTAIRAISLRSPMKVMAWAALLLW